ncbi:helix-turn-helix domain-containing protein [Hutsoniella sourekii]
MDAMNKKLGATLKEIRINRNLKQYELPGIKDSSSRISKHENGQQVLSVENLIKYSHSLQMNVEEVLFLARDQQIDPRRVLLNRFDQAWDACDLEQMEAAYFELDEFALTNPHDSLITHLAGYVLHYLGFMRGDIDSKTLLTILESEAQAFEDQLGQAKAYYLTDLCLLNLALRLLPLRHFAEYYPGCQERYQEYYIEFLMQASLYCMRTYDRDLASQVFAHLDQLPPEHLSFRHFIYFIVRRAIIEKSASQIQRGLELAQLSDIPLLEERLSFEVMKFYPEYFINHPQVFTKLNQLPATHKWLKEPYWIF